MFQLSFEDHPNPAASVSCGRGIHVRVAITDQEPHVIAVVSPFRCPRAISLKARLRELDDVVSDPRLYEDSERAMKIVKERAQIEAQLDTVDKLTAELQTWRDMHGEEMAVTSSSAYIAARELVNPLRRQSLI